MDGMKKIKIIAFLAFFVAIMSLGVGYSTLNTTLEINGIAKVYEEKYEVSVSNIHNVLKSEGETTISDPLVKDDVITFDFKLTQLNNYVSFMFDIVNTGNQDAIVKDIHIEGLDPYVANLEVNFNDSLKNTVITGGETLENNLIKIGYKEGIFDPYLGFQAVELRGVRVVVKLEKV